MNQARHPRVAAARQQLLRDQHLRPVGQLGLQPGLLGDETVVLVGQDLDLGPGLGVVHDQQLLALGDMVALVDEDLADDAAVELGDGLAVVLEHHLARDRHAASHREQGGPHHESDDEDEDGYAACDDWAVQQALLLDRDRGLGRALERTRNHQLGSGKGVAHRAASA